MHDLYFKYALNTVLNKKKHMIILLKLWNGRISRQEFEKYCWNT